MAYTTKAEYEIHDDGTTVWVNGPMGLLGRFGNAGIDVHKPANEQHFTGECLHCTHKMTTKEDWDIFKAKMLEHFKIEVPDKHKPRRFLNLQ